MKFTEHLQAHLTPEWRKQYIRYEDLKHMLYAKEKEFIEEGYSQAEQERFIINFDEEFFNVCEAELTKINTFFAEKLAEAIRKLASLKFELAIYTDAMANLQSTATNKMIMSKLRSADGTSKLGLVGARNVGTGKARFRTPANLKDTNKKASKINGVFGVDSSLTDDLEILMNSAANTNFSPDKKDDDNTQLLNNQHNSANTNNTNNNEDKTTKILFTDQTTPNIIINNSDINSMTDSNNENDGGIVGKRNSRPQGMWTSFWRRPSDKKDSHNAVNNRNGINAYAKAHSTLATNANANSLGTAYTLPTLTPGLAKRSRKKAEDLKLAFSEYYLSLVLLQNYQQLNYTGFRKILKKHDKLFSTETGTNWRIQNVDNAPFYTNQDINRFIQEVESLYTNKLVAGDRTKAMKRLRVPPLSEQKSLWTSFRLGLFLGFFIILVIVIILAAIFTNHRDDWRPAVRIFRGAFLVVLFTYLLGINTYGWQSAGVNHVLIFEIDPRNHLTDQQILEIASILGVMWACAVLVYLFSETLRIPALLSPLILVALFVLFLLNPTPTLYYRSRFWLLRILWRICNAPFYHVGFADFWLADQLNSLVTVLLDFEYLFCFYALEVEWLPDRRKGVCFTNSYGVRPVIAMLPAWFRFFQCLRRYRDSKQAFPHLLNAGKYSTTFFVVLFSTLHTFQTKATRGHDITLYMWIGAAIFSSLYAYAWDIKRDWGLLDNTGITNPSNTTIINSASTNKTGGGGGVIKSLRTSNSSASSNEYPLLREQMVYGRPSYYYLAMVQDLVLRFAWTLTVSVGKEELLEADILISILAPLEVFRRFVWNFFRLENEHLNNCGQFRAVRDISIAPISKNDLAQLETLMDERDYECEDGKNGNAIYHKTNQNNIDNDDGDDDAEFFSLQIENMPDKNGNQNRNGSTEKLELPNKHITTEKDTPIISNEEYIEPELHRTKRQQKYTLINQQNNHFTDNVSIIPQTLVNSNRSIPSYVNMHKNVETIGKKLNSNKECPLETVPEISYLPTPPLNDNKTKIENIVVSNSKPKPPPKVEQGPSAGSGDASMNAVGRKGAYKYSSIYKIPVYLGPNQTTATSLSFQKNYHTITIGNSGHHHNNKYYPYLSSNNANQTLSGALAAAFKKNYMLTMATIPTPLTTFTATKQKTASPLVPINEFFAQPSKKGPSGGKHSTTTSFKLRHHKPRQKMAVKKASWPLSINVNNPMPMPTPPPTSTLDDVLLPSNEKSKLVDNNLSVTNITTNRNRKKSKNKYAKLSKIPTVTENHVINNEDNDDDIIALNNAGPGSYGRKKRQKKNSNANINTITALNRHNATKLLTTASTSNDFSNNSLSGDANCETEQLTPSSDKVSTSVKF